MESESSTTDAPKITFSNKMISKSQPTFFDGIRYEHLLAGLAGGVASTLITHPFDLTKIRFAVNDGSVTNERPKYKGFLHAVKTITKEDGWRGLYRGASANVTGAGLSWGLYFYFYNAFKFHFQEGDINYQLNPQTHLLLASCAGILTLTLTNPIWVIKTRLCLPNTSSIPAHMRYRGLSDGLIKLCQYEGIKGLYKGYIPGIIGTSHGAVQFMVYEELKKFYCNTYAIPITNKLGPLEYILMAAISKAVAASVTYPYQVVRARLQDQEQKYSGVMNTISRTYRFEGVRGFYKGLTPNLMKVVPATCITFVVYEYTSQFMLSRRQAGER